MQRPGRWQQRLATLSIAFLLLGGLLWAGWYVYYRGFTRKWRAQLSAELRRRGLDFEARRLTLNPFEGLVAEDAHLYLLDAHHTPVLYISRVAVDISVHNLIQHKSFLNSLDLRGARLTIPIDTADPDGPKLRLRHFQAKLAFLPDEVKLTQAQGDFYGLQISASGALLHPGDFSSAGPAASDEERARRRQFARLIVEEIQKVHSDRAPPRLEIRFQGDLARPALLRVSSVLQGDALQRGSYRINHLLVRLDYVATAFHLQEAELTDARGTLSAQGDLNPKAHDARFQLQSSLDLVALAREFAPWISLGDFTFRTPPQVRLDGQAHFPAADRSLAAAVAATAPAPAPSPTSPQAPLVANNPPAAVNGRALPASPTLAPMGPPVPPSSPAPTTAVVPSGTAALVSPPPPPPAAPPILALTGHLGLGEFSYRALKFTMADTDLAWSGDRWYLRGLHLVRAGDGDQQITADVLSEPAQWKIRLNSTVDLEPLAGYLPERARQVFNDLRFQTPPHVNLTATSRSWSDLEHLSLAGQVTLNHTRFRGVGLNRLHTDFTYEDRFLTFKHFTVERDEGTGTGDAFVYDLNKHEVRLTNIRATLDPAQVCVWIDSDVARAVAPFHFRKPPGTITNGVVQFDGGRNSALTVDVNAPAGFSYVFLKKTLNFQNVLGQVLFNDDRLRLNDLRAESFSGQVEGNLDLSLVRGARDYTAFLDVKALDFASLTKLYFDYDNAKGQLSGSYHFTGRGDDPRTLHGAGSLSIDRGNVFAIPFLGPLSGIINALLPGLGFDVAHQATVDFLTSEGKIITGNLAVKGAGFNLFGGGWLGYLDDTMNFRVRINSRGLPGAVLYPVSKLFEYSSQGPLAKPVWRPRVLEPHPPIVDNSPAPPPPAHLFAPEPPEKPGASPKRP